MCAFVRVPIKVVIPLRFPLTPCASEETLVHPAAIDEMTQEA